MPLAQPERRATGDQDPGCQLSLRPGCHKVAKRGDRVLSLARSRAESVGHGLGASELPAGGGGSCKLS